MMSIISIMSISSIISNNNNRHGDPSFLIWGLLLVEEVVGIGLWRQLGKGGVGI